MLWKLRVSGTFFIALIFTIVVLTVSIFLFISGENYTDVFNAERGVLELTAGDFRYSILLDGEWKFWEGQLITNESESAEAFSIVNVPHAWNGTGYGTYGLTIDGLTPGNNYCLNVPDTSTAYSLFIDSVNAAVNGRVGTDFESETIHWEPQIVYFTAGQPRVELMFQVSNFKSYPGGFIRAMKLGLPDKIIEQKTRNVSAQTILFGALLIIALYNLCLYLLSREDKAALFFAFFNLLLAARIPITGEKIINAWLSSPNWWLLLKLQFVFGASMLAMFIMFMKNLFPGMFNNKLVILMLGFSTLLGLAGVILPMHYLAPADLAFLACTILFFLYIIISLVMGVRKKVQGSTFAFIGMLFVLASVIIDGRLPSGTNIIPLGIFIFIIFQSLVIGEKHSYIMEQNRILHGVATRDGMTNLYNKDHFQKLIRSIIEDEESFGQHGLMFLDIDNFKFINDTYGHDTGDSLLKNFAEKMLHSLRYSDIACRFGGDEFLVWLHNTSPEEALLIARRILDGISEPVNKDGVDILLSVSIGISFFPDDGDVLDDLVSLSDRRMYEAKRQGKNRYYSGR